MQRTHNSPKASSILARSIATGLPFGQNLNPSSKMKNLSNVDMSDLAKEWEVQMGTRNQAQTHTYRLLYNETANESQKVEGVKTEKVELTPRPLWNAP